VVSSESAQTLMFQFAGELAILVHGELPPTDDEWGAWLDSLEQRVEKMRKGSPRCLVIADNVAPSPKQRVALNKLVQKFGAPVPTAVITHSVAARGVVSILGWFNSAIRAFSPNELTEALQYLSIDLAQREDVLTRILRMRVALSQSLPSSDSVDLEQIANDMDSLMLKRLPSLRPPPKRE